MGSTVHAIGRLRRSFAIGIIALVATHSFAAASDAPYLSIRLVDVDSTNPPDVSVPGTEGCCDVHVDPNTGEWRLPLERDTGNLVTPYVVAVDSPSREVVAMRLMFPSGVEHEDQSLVIRKPRYGDASEATVRRLWQELPIDKDAANPREQLGYLQDLYFIVERQRESDDSLRVSAARVQAAFLLLKIVRNLGVRTWYVVDNKYQEVVDFAFDIVDKSARGTRHCRWLGSPSCDGTSDLLDSIKKLAGSRLGRIYHLILTDNASYDSAFCDEQRIANLRTYFDYFMETTNSLNAAYLRSGSGVSEIRIANDIAACTVTRVACGDETANRADALLKDAIERIERAKQAYDDRDEGKKAANRVIELGEIRRAVMSGSPVRCPSR